LLEEEHKTLKLVKEYMTINEDQNERK